MGGGYGKAGGVCGGDDSWVKGKSYIAYGDADSYEDSVKKCCRNPSSVLQQIRRLKKK